MRRVCRSGSRSPNPTTRTAPMPTSLSNKRLAEQSRGVKGARSGHRASRDEAAPAGGIEQLGAAELEAVRSRIGGADSTDNQHAMGRRAAREQRRSMARARGGHRLVASRRVGVESADPREVAGG